MQGRDPVDIKSAKVSSDGRQVTLEIPGLQPVMQMLIRFRPDVIALHPKVVVILAGTNDIAGNTGPSTLEAIEDNLMSMVDLAKANEILDSLV